MKKTILAAILAASVAMPAAAHAATYKSVTDATGDAYLGYGTSFKPSKKAADIKQVTYSVGSTTFSIKYRMNDIANTTQAKPNVYAVGEVGSTKIQVGVWSGKGRYYRTQYLKVNDRVTCSSETKSRYDFAANTVVFEIPKRCIPAGTITGLRGYARMAYSEDSAYAYDSAPRTSFRVR